MPSSFMNLKRDLLRTFRTYLVRSNRYAPLFFINCQLYRGIEKFIKFSYSSIPEVNSIYLAHGSALGEVYPGLSDFDISIVFESSDNGNFYSSLRSVWMKLKQFLPARDIILYTRPEFELWQKLGGSGELLDELKHWKCIYGRDLRKGDYNLESPQSENDRIGHVLIKYQSLLLTVIKEEPNNHLLAIKTRRNLYKNFCSCIFPLNSRYLSIGNQFQRLSKWIEENGEDESLVHELLKMHENRFQGGEISTLKFKLGALCYKTIDKALENCNFRFASNYAFKETTIPLSNLLEVRERVKNLSSGIVELLKEKLESIMLLSNGSPFGYLFLVILRENLNVYEIEESLKILHLIFRINDDPWFNEYFSAKIPILYSKSMFFRHMELWHVDRNYAHYHRIVLFGTDLYNEFIENRPTSNIENNFEEDLIREKLNLSRYLHQIHPERVKPAVFEAISIHYPRIYLFQKMGWSPTTLEEAIFHYEKLKDPRETILAKTFFEKYGRKNIHDIKLAMTDNEFDEAWAFLRNEISLN